MAASPDVEMPSAALNVAHQETLDAILTKLTFIERRLKHYPTVEASECIKDLQNLFEYYDDIRGQPKWLVKRIRKYPLRYHRALSVLYPHMQPTEKLVLTKLMRFEAYMRYKEALKNNVSVGAALRCKELKKLRHVAELWSTFLEAEKSMLMRKEGPLVDAHERYETLDSFKWLCMHGSLDGKTEALSFLSENSDKVQTDLRTVQGAHVKFEDKRKEVDLPSAEESAEFLAKCREIHKRWWGDAKASGQVDEMYMGTSRASGSEPQPLTPEKISESSA